MNDPSVVLADEPTGQLDSATGMQIMELLKEINAKGTTVVVVTHDSKVTAMANRIINISDGRVTL